MRIDDELAFPSGSHFYEKDPKTGLPYAMGYEQKGGMTLRDYFASGAQRICPFNAYQHEESAEWCYQRADAMLKARSQ